MDLSNIRGSDMSHVFKKNLIDDLPHHPFGVKRTRLDYFTYSSTPNVTSISTSAELNLGTSLESVPALKINRDASEKSIIVATVDLSTAPIVETPSTSKSKARARIPTIKPTSSDDNYFMLQKRNPNGPRLYFNSTTSHAQLIELDLNNLRVIKEDRRKTFQSMLEALSADDVEAFNEIFPEFLNSFNIKYVDAFVRGEFKSYLSRYAFLFGASKILKSREYHFMRSPVLQPELINLDCVKYLIKTKPSGVALYILLRFRSYLENNQLLDQSLILFKQSSPSLNYFQQILLDNFSSVESYLADLFTDESNSELETFSKISGFFHIFLRRFESIFMPIFRERFEEFFGQCADLAKINFVRGIILLDDAKLLREVHEKFGDISGLIYSKNYFYPIRSSEPNFNLLDWTIELGARNCFRYLVQTCSKMLSDVSKKTFSTLSFICDYNRLPYLDILIEMEFLNAIAFTDNSKSYDIVQYAFLKKNETILEHLFSKLGSNEIIGRLLMIWDSAEELLIHSININFGPDVLKFVFKLLDIQVTQAQLHYFRSLDDLSAVTQSLRSDGIAKVLENITEITSNN